MTVARTLLAVVAAAGALALGGCASDESPGGAERVDLALDFYVNPDHAGIYEALERGFFRRAGLDVHPQVPSDPSAPIKEVATGQVDLAISYEPEVLIARAQGLPVVAVAALVNRPLTSLISLPEAGIRTPADLAGSTIATAGIPYQDAFLEAILARAGLTPDDVTEVSVGLNLLPAVLSGRADAMLGGFSNVEGVDLALRGRDPRVVPVNRLGIPSYDELVLVANSQSVRSDPKPIREFIAALERGTRAAAAHPAEATQAILKAGSGLEPKLTAAEVRRTLPLLLPPGGNDPFGWMDRAGWARFARFMAAHDLLDSRPPVGEVVDNGLLARRTR